MITIIITVIIIRSHKQEQTIHSSIQYRAAHTKHKHYVIKGGGAMRSGGGSGVLWGRWAKHMPANYSLLMEHRNKQLSNKRVTAQMNK